MNMPYTLSNFNCEVETEKAFLLEKDGIKFWCPKKCIKKDGTLYKAFIEKYEDAKEEEKKSDFKNSYHECLTEVYSAFSLRVACYLSCSDMDLPINDKIVLFFCPVSILNNKEELPGWFLLNKIEEIKSRYSCDNYIRESLDIDFNPNLTILANYVFKELIQK